MKKGFTLIEVLGSVLILGSLILKKEKSIKEIKESL